MKGRSIIDNVFLAIKTIDWATETSHPMVMLLLDFEKAYDRVEWDFLEGTLNKLGFNSTWISWIRALYIDSWCSIRLNGQASDPFKLTRSIKQGCPLAPFLYLFAADSLGYILEKDVVVTGLKLPENGGDVINQEYADNTNLHLEGSLQNLDCATRALEVFASALGAKINLNKLHAIWIFESPMPFNWGEEVELQWLQSRETTRYLGFHIGFKVTAEKHFEGILHSLRKN